MSASSNFFFLFRFRLKCLLFFWGFALVFCALVWPALAEAAQATVFVPPTPQDDYATTNEDQPISFFVVINDTDPDGTVIPTTITLARGPAHGFALIDDLNGVVVYVPALDYHGPDSVDYQICDDDGECAVATLYLTVLPRNDAPRVRRDVVNADAGASVLVEPLLNDDDLRDPGSGINAMSASVLSGPFHGALTEAVPGIPGRYHFTPDPAFIGLDSFQYRVCDLGLPLPALCAQAWVQIVVAAPPAFDPNKPLEGEAWPGAPLVLDGWGAERKAAGFSPDQGPVPASLGPDPASQTGQNTAETVLVYDRQGALVHQSMGAAITWSSSGLPLNLPLAEGTYFFAWWTDPLVKAWPQRRGTLKIGP